MDLLHVNEIQFKILYIIFNSWKNLLKTLYTAYAKETVMTVARRHEGRLWSLKEFAAYICRLNYRSLILEFIISESKVLNWILNMVCLFCAYIWRLLFRFRQFGFIHWSYIQGVPRNMTLAKSSMIFEFIFKI